MFANPVFITPGKKKSINHRRSVAILASMHTGPYDLKNKYIFRQFTGLFKTGHNIRKKSF